MSEAKTHVKENSSELARLNQADNTTGGRKLPTKRGWKKRTLDRKRRETTRILDENRQNRQAGMEIFKKEQGANTATQGFCSSPEHSDELVLKASITAGI